MSPNKQVLVISTGGAITAASSAAGVLQPEPMSKERLLRRIPDLERECGIKCQEIMNVSSELLAPHDWIRLSDVIHTVQDQYAGIVVLHGSSTLSYTAAALSLMLQHLSVPVVLTTSLLPLEYVSSDACANIKDAVKAAAVADLAEVCLMHDGMILRGCRVKKIRDIDYAMYDVTHTSGYLGTIRGQISLQGEYRPRKERRMTYQPTLETDIGVHLMRPGFNSNILDSIIAHGSRGLVLVGYGTGTIPHEGPLSIIPSIEEARRQGMVVMIANQTAYGQCELGSYRGGCKAREAGAVSAHDMTYEAAIVKMMWVLGQTNDRAEAIRMLESNYVGEITAPVMEGAKDYFADALHRD
jgi:L-asparaginase